MSVAVGVEANGGVWLGSDSYMSTILEGVTLRGKVFVLDGIGFGVVGSMRHAQVVEHHLSVPPRRKESPEAWAVKRLVPVLKDLYEEHKLGDEDDQGMDLIVAVGGQLMNLQSDWAIYRALEGYAAVGTGSSVALGSLYATTKRGAQRRVREAVEAACHHVPNVAQPIHTLWVPA